MRSSYSIDYKKSTIVLERKNVITTIQQVIRLWAQDFLYYSDIEYDEDLRCYLIWNP